MKIAIVVGHNSVQQGAYSKHLEKSEYDYWRDVANRIKKLNKKIDIHFREYSNSYTLEMKKVIEELNGKNYDLILELHFNSAGNENANGVEVLYYHNNLKAKSYSELYQNMTNKKFGSNKRTNIAIENSSQRGSYGVLNSKATYLLTELFFGSNEEALKFKDTNTVAKFYLEFLKEIGGKKKVGFWEKIRGKWR